VLPEGAAAAANDDERTGTTLFLVDTEGRPAGRGRVDGRKLTYAFEEATPGEFSVRWYRQGQTLLVRKVEIPAGGANDLTLPFELPAPGEVIPPLFPNLPPGARRIELGAH
jgi:hypothetical protein